ncbi:MAG: hypothetical protein IJ283_02235 [Oscillospiraceae bacterium]|nr:hypothetical protein [Oscillospiraceae bacterium]
MQNIIATDKKIKGKAKSLPFFYFSSRCSAANLLKEKALADFPEAKVFIELTGALCSFYAERGGLIIGFES